MSASSALGSPAAPSEEASRPRVLIVDDYEANLLALEALLAPLEVEVIRATSGDEALKHLLQHDFAVVLMDVQMPGLNGFETTELMRKRERTRHTPIIFVTSIFKDREWATKGYALGAYDYLTKPFDEDVLRAKVAAIIGTHRQSDFIRKQAEALREKQWEADREHVARKAAESANRAKDNFLAMISHELRAPLNAVLGWSAILEARKDLPADIEKPVGVIARNARVQSRLIDDLLDVSRIVAGKLSIMAEPMDLSALVQSTVETARLTATERNEQINLAVAPGNYAMVGDRTRLGQVVSNLLSNAIKFSIEGGQVEVALSRQQNGFRIRVQDSGIGIPAAFLPHVFDRFQQADDSRTRQYGGLGLGLTVTKYLVKVHGGTIAAESAGEGKGATFTVDLPAAHFAEFSTHQVVIDGEPPARLSPAVAVAKTKETCLSGLRILVVDDDRDARELIGQILESAGAVVTMTASAGEAVMAFASEPYAAFISDLGMPGEDGLSLARKLRDIDRQRGGAVVAVALSGYGGGEDRAASLEAGFDVHLVKPAEPSTIVARVKQLVESRRSPR